MFLSFFVFGQLFRQNYKDLHFGNFGKITFFLFSNTSFNITGIERKKHNEEFRVAQHCATQKI
jgi:hypothetical protein